MTLVLLCTIVRVKLRVGTVRLRSRRVASRLSESVDVVKVDRLKQSNTYKLEENKHLEGLG